MTAETEYAGLSSVWIAVILIWPLVVAVSVVLFVAPVTLHLGDLRGAVSSRPPMAVIDVTRSPPDKVRAAARTLSSHGYVVFDARAVYAYPPAVEATP